MRLCLFLFCLANGWSQTSIQHGANAPNANNCNAPNSVGRLYEQSNNPGGGPNGVFRCTQVGTSSYGWMPIGHITVASVVAVRCSIGDVAFVTTGATGQQWYGCTATDTWTLLTVSSWATITGGTSGAGITFNLGAGASLNPGSGHNNADQLNGVQISGVPSANQSLIATGGASANWGLVNLTNGVQLILPRANGGTANTAGAIPQLFFGTAPPGSVTGNLPGDLFSDTTNHHDYWCNAVSGTAAPACTSVTTGGWTQLDGGGGGAGNPCTSVALAYQFNNAGAFGCANMTQNADGTSVASKAITVPAPSAPTFNAGGTTTCDWSASNVCSFTMTGNTTLAVSNPHGSGPYLLKITMDATGNRTVTYPGSFQQVCQPSGSANVETSIALIYDGSANYFQLAPCTSTDTSTYISGPERAPVTTTSSGAGAMSFGNASHTAEYYANTSVNRHIMPRVASGSSDQMACADLSDSTILCSVANPFLTNAQSATYQVLAADFTSYKTILVGSGTFTITLVASGTQPANGKFIRVINYGSGVVTISRSGQNINGGTASLTLNAANATAPSSAMVQSSGTDYFAWVNNPGGGGGGGSTPVCVGAANQYFVPGLGFPGFINIYNNDADLLIAPAANNTSLMHFFAPCQFTVSRLVLNSPSTPGGANCKVELGLYNDTQSLVLHTGVITDVTTVNCNSTGFKILTASTSPACVGCGTTFAPGWYWLGATSNENTMKLTSYVIDSLQANFMNNAVTTGALATLSGAQATTNGALNSTFTTGSGFVASFPTYFVEFAMGQ